MPLLRQLRRRSATARIAPLAARWTRGMERLGVELGAWSLHVSAGVARADAAAAGLPTAPPLLVYTVNDATRARKLFAQGAAGLFTDRPGGLRAELGMLGDSGVLSMAYRGTRALRPSV
jgi:glycerophosphoryl diester phosphodiesterase